MTPRRGFRGRPLIALLSAAGIGILAGYTTVRWQLNGRLMSLAGAAFIGVAGLICDRAEKPK